MSAVGEYKAVRHDINHGGLPPFSGEQMSRIRDAADAAIAEMEAELASEREYSTSVLQCATASAACQRLAVVENARLEAENERLKCCGNCADAERET